MWLSDGELRGRTVIASDGQAIGAVQEFLLETGNWSVGALRVRLRREVAERLGASRGLFHAGTVELSVAAVQSVGDAILLNTDVEGLRRYLSGEGATVHP
jgi:sporulation protein YlmC with PRC-barrel domain